MKLVKLKYHTNFIGGNVTGLAYLDIVGGAVMVDNGAEKHKIYKADSLLEYNKNTREWTNYNWGQ